MDFKGLLLLILLFTSVIILIATLLGKYDKPRKPRLPSGEYLSAEDALDLSNPQKVYCSKDEESENTIKKLQEYIRILEDEHTVLLLKIDHLEKEA